MIQLFATAIVTGIGFGVGLAACNAAPRAIRAGWKFIRRLN
jgi:hypothetical protein